jgi:hypothetical protein
MFASLIGLISCDYTYYLYRYGSESVHRKEVLSIDFISYNDEKVEDHPLDEYKLNLNHLKILETLLSENCNSYVIELEQIGGLGPKYKKVLNAPLGNGIRITYEDESFTLITVTTLNDEEYESLYYGDYSVDLERGFHSSFIGYDFSLKKMIDEFKELTNRYFENQISVD